MHFHRVVSASASRWIPARHVRVRALERQHSGRPNDDEWAAGTLAVPVQVQTIDDGGMLAKQGLFVGDLYPRENWDEYWQGTLKRDNGNIGTFDPNSRHTHRRHR